MAAYETIRAFVGLNLEVAAIRAAALAAELLREKEGAPPARWVSPPKMHLTLRFLGDVDLGLVPALRDTLAGLAALRSSPWLALSGYGAFPAPDEARVVFAKVDDMGGETASLARDLNERLSTLGFEAPAQPFVPHVTLARLRAPVDVRAWLASAPPSRVVGLGTDLALYRSDLSRPGQEYDVLGRFPLASRAG